MGLRSWLLRQASSVRSLSSVADRFRRRRWEVIHETLELRGGESVVDVGGNDRSWWFAQWSGPLTRCNLNPKSRGIRAVAEGCALPFADAAFDVAFSDRKSTRLNSSHSQISYAVFCLKKKTKEY